MGKLLDKVLKVIAKADYIRDYTLPAGYRTAATNVSQIGDMDLERFNGLMRVSFKGQVLETFQDADRDTIYTALSKRRKELKESALSAFINS